jgi:hypothetical protein
VITCRYSLVATNGAAKELVVVHLMLHIAHYRPPLIIVAPDALCRGPPAGDQPATVPSLMVFRRGCQIAKLYADD